MPITNYQLRIRDGTAIGASPPKPSPSGRGWGEGETPLTLHLSRNRQPATPDAAGVLDSGLRRNDGRGWRLLYGVGGVGRLSLTPPSPAGRGLCGLRHHPVIIPIQSFPPPHSSFPPPCSVIPAPHRHSRESGNPHPGLPPRRGLPRFWIPAYAGMTVEGQRQVIQYPIRN